MCGLQGVGKTTYCAKLGLMLKNQGNRPLLVACDIYRPAAIKQLQVVGEKAGVPVFEKGTADPVEIAREAIKLAKDQGYDYVLLDTAGRLHIDEELMDELKRVKAEIKPVKLPWRQTISPAPLIIKGFFREVGKEQSIPSELQMFSPFDNAWSKWDKRSCWVSITDKITGCTENCPLS